ncbi:MAG: alpha/beta hydrolase [Gammaproteobacteria bacterium]|nr:alpha/beta hydrolase [Gammaproteobacteria bacterium]
MTFDQSAFAANKCLRVLRNGIALAYAECGNPQGHPLLFLHGFTDSAASWAPLVPHLAHLYRMILVDLRGHGGSSRPAGGYARRDLAMDLVLLLDELGLVRVDVIGHSLGSLVAQNLGEDWPARVRRLVLISSTATPEPGPDEFDLAGAVAGLEDPIDPNSDFMTEWFANPTPVDAAFLAAARREAAAMPARLWRRICKESLRLDELTAELPRLSAPALLIWGAMDPIFGPRHRISLCRALPGATVRIHGELGHNPFWEQPALIAHDIAEFLALRWPYGSKS